jgi:hypothetical protein
MDFEGDAFISYAHLDNVELVEGQKGWVANLHRALEIRVAQLLGKSPQIWRDPKLQGNDLLAETLIERLRRVAVLVTVVSPRYVKSEWTLRELAEFWKAAEQQGGIHLFGRARVFKVLKTPVAVEKTPPELRELLGYEFFKVESESGKIRELDEVFGPSAQRDFWLKLDDLAHDMCALLEALEGGTRAPTEAGGDDQPGAVFLAETTSDVREPREALKRDLQQHGLIVLPSGALPLVAVEAAAAVRADLARSRMSIHLIGRNYGVVPEGGTQSLLEIQNELSIERSQQGGFSRLLWIPPGLQVDDERQQKMIERVRLDQRAQQGTDLLETFLEDLKTVIQDALRRPPPSVRVQTGPAAAPRELPRVYLIYDQRDEAAASVWANALFDDKLEVIRTLFDGDEAEIREYHEENLAICDGVLILHGASNELWLRRKLREIQKSAGYGRSKPKPEVAVLLVGARTAEKERFRTHEAIVVPQWDGYTREALQPFVSRLKGLV